jgi:hypothetical protein
MLLFYHTVGIESFYQIEIVIFRLDCCLLMNIVLETVVYHIEFIRIATVLFGNVLQHSVIVLCASSPIPSVELTDSFLHHLLLSIGFQFEFASFS